MNSGCRRRSIGCSCRAASARAAADSSVSPVTTPTRRCSATIAPPSSSSRVPRLPRLEACTRDPFATRHDTPRQLRDVSHANGRARRSASRPVHRSLDPGAHRRPTRPRTRFDVEPISGGSSQKLSTADQAFYTARAISLRAQLAPKEARPAMWPQAESEVPGSARRGIRSSGGSVLPRVGLALAREARRGGARVRRDGVCGRPRRLRHRVCARAIAAAPGTGDDARARIRSARSRSSGRCGPSGRLGPRAREQPGLTPARSRCFSKRPLSSLGTRRSASTRRSCCRRSSAMPRRSRRRSKRYGSTPEAAATWDAYATLLYRAGRVEDSKVAANRTRQLAKAPGTRLSDAPAMSPRLNASVEM